ncbi:DsbA family oxidoreductase [Corynebacterium phoceense]|uniref:DsbA family oxidoreductase n=1 Tax=Corynebacterium phoceense TaxID=1686286 RepID=A0A540R8W6_9CORY|nr:DsbA family oxidoreductase [Corynebacterium phoceense]TQE44189.1 DsbA family oxidoreductase [Corynebacterium phoceense]
MRIDIWSDIICPFCIIGKRHLELALERFEHADEVDIHWHSFELDPNAAPYSGCNVVDMVASKYGSTREQAEAAQLDIARRAEAVGLTFNWEVAKPGNTFAAHRLMHAAWDYFAAQPADAPAPSPAAVEEAFITAYFTDGLDISDPEVLHAIATELGLPAQRVTEVLDSDAYADAVRADEDHAHQLSITGVPFFLIENKWAVSGAQPVELFVQALNQVWDETHKQPAALNVIGGIDSGAACGPDGC